ncbi:MAG: vacuolar sorting protein VPS33/slp1 [Vezdaea aestivalis]|nr:MAG: vacuolar sorting protein VPS33/slp1 [Vezdaea aestivalis]
MQVLVDSSEWKVLVVDEASRKILDNVIKEDEILNENVTHVERIEERRKGDATLDALYFISPEPHIVDCLMADFESSRYKASHILWTALLSQQQSRRLGNSRMAQNSIVYSQTLSVNFYPRESHIVTFRDPYSFPILYHPECNNLVKDHFQALAAKIKGVCIALDEYPIIKYFRPQHSRHDASVLCSHLARFVQEELDEYKSFYPDFGAHTNRPPGCLFVVDRSLDLYGPLLHEFTYQAMAHDLMPIKEGDKITYRMKINEGQSDEEEKDLELSEKDALWIENRHLHMQETTQRLESNFNNESGSAVKLNAIKDMLADLPEFQNMKEAYSLHLSLVSDCMALLGERKLLDTSLVEQSLATGLDETGQKLRNIAEELVALLDDPSIVASDRLRLVMLYLIYREGVVENDITMLLAHAQLPPAEFSTIVNLTNLGARILKSLSEKSSFGLSPPIFQARRPVEGVPAVSRFQPALKTLLEDHITGSLDSATFPSLNPAAPQDQQEALNQASLRAVKPGWANPQWASSRLKAIAPRQRIIIFVAGGATFAEARACYEISEQTSRDVFLATSHMIHPSFFIRQVADLSVDRRRLNVPPDRPKPRAPAHLFEKPEAKPPPPSKGASSTSSSTLSSSMAGMKISEQSRPRPSPAPSSERPNTGQPPAGKVKVDKDEKKKKHHFFSSKR